MASFSGRVAQNNDDGYLAGSWTASGSTFRTGKAFAGNNVIGAIRINNVTIPQGATVTAATITLQAGVTDGDAVNLKIYGIDEDDTADLSSDPTGRSRTTAAVDWDFGAGVTAGNDYVSPDITSIIQEIVNRGGWASGNDMGFIIDDDGSSNDKILDWDTYEGDSAHAALLDVTYSGASPSSSVSPSSSISRSPSPSPSVSASVSVSASPSPIDRFFGLKVLKDNRPFGINVLNTEEPYHFIFNSDYGTLKYFSKVTSQMQIDGSVGDFAGRNTINHNLGYYPFVEVFVRVYIGSPAGNYEYVPFAGSGASVFYSANFRVTTTQIILYGEFNGVSSSIWNFDFIIFIYKNNLQL